MLKRIRIKNFKSIKDIDLELGRINIFIGEPNTGKTNILEAFSLLSWSQYRRDYSLKDFVRLKNISNLYYDNILDEPVEIDVWDNNLQLKMNVLFSNGSFKFDIKENQDPWQTTCKMDYAGRMRDNIIFSHNILKAIKLYKFKESENFPIEEPGYLLPPYGDNLFAVALGSKKLRDTLTEFIENFKYRLVFKMQEKIFEIQKQIENLIFEFPYNTLSDTVRRLMFYLIAMESNKDSALIFEEPEAYAFPFYTKQLGELIAFNEVNQYFIATHNQYFLSAICEKAPREDIAVFLVSVPDYSTEVKKLNLEEIEELLSCDPFLNIGNFLNKEI